MNNQQSHQGQQAPETKAIGDDVANAFDEFMQAFEAFKESNDERLNQLESGNNSDVVTTQKMNRINRSLDEQKSRMDELMLKNQRPGIDGSHPISATQFEHKKAFDDYVRRGNENGLRQFEEKAMSHGSDADGGYLVPDETANEIGKRLTAISPIRSISSVRTISSALYKKPFAINGPASGWVAETDARPQTATATLSELQFPTMELYAMPAATSMLLDDAAVDIDGPK